MFRNLITLQFSHNLKGNHFLGDYYAKLHLQGVLLYLIFLDPHFPTDFSKEI